MHARLRVWLVLAAMTLLAGPAVAEEEATHTDTKHRYSVSAPEAFRFTKTDSLLGSYTGPGKLRLSLSRIHFPSLAAWRKREQKEFFESVVDGALEGWKRLGSTQEH